MPHEVKREMRRRGIISLTPAPSPGGEGSDVPIDIVYIYIQIYNDKTELRAGYCVEGAGVSSKDKYLPENLHIQILCVIFAYRQIHLLWNGQYQERPHHSG